LKEKQVKVIPGYLYGKNMDDFLRISMSVPDEEYRRGIETFLEFIEELE
jgi:aspartate/methionine/tyrosine aminotransferase